MVRFCSWFVGLCHRQLQCLRSAIHTSLMMETARIMGISAGILFIDLQKNCDGVDLVLLTKACSVLGCPRIPLLQLVQAFFWDLAR